jgi:hypothetical protein
VPSTGASCRAAFIFCRSDALELRDVDSFLGLEPARGLQNLLCTCTFLGAENAMAFSDKD